VGCPRTFPRSKHGNLSYEQALGACAANQEMQIVALRNICAANQDTAEYSTTSVKPIRCEKSKQGCRKRPRSDGLVFRAAQMHALVGFLDAATWLLAPDSRVKCAPRAPQLREFHTTE
jgi:hypothetical protein